MIVTKKAIARRTVLRGLGATLALPLLDGMVPALSALSRTAAAPVARLGAVYVPNGIAMENWTPAMTGTAFELPPSLQPLAPVQDRLLVLTGLNSTPLSGPQGVHARASTRFLTGVPPTYAQNAELYAGDLDGPARREGAGCAHTTGLPRARLGRRRFRWVVRQRL